MFMMRPLMLGNGLLSALRPQDVFATSLYTGTGASRIITNGLDLLGKGGLVWGKLRDTASSHGWHDNLRGVSKELSSNSTAGETDRPGSDVTAFTSTGYTLGAAANMNLSGQREVGWSFVRASKFFDIVTYTGDGTSGRVIPHALGIKPGMIIVKRRNVSGDDWPVYHRSLPAPQRLWLDRTDAVANNSAIWSSEPTDTGFVVGTDAAINASGATYVAYLFAHDPDTTNGIVQCGSATADGGGTINVNLGWPLQWILFRPSNSAAQWHILDTSRGVGSALFANLSAAEGVPAFTLTPTATGFSATGFSAGATVIFCAIRAPI